MLKYIYRVIILICIFVASIYYFSKDIKEVVFNLDNTTVMEDATFPLVTIKSGENEINLLHGYSSNLNANTVREAVTPLDLTQTFEVLINQESELIKKLNYELREVVNNELIETNSVSVFGESDDKKSAKIKLNAELVPEKEYAVKITLITSESKKMYYYHRIKIYDNSYLKEKLGFVMEFHNAIKNKDAAKGMEQYLEPEKDADNTSLSYANINSSLDLISWGSLRPTFLTKVIPTIKEIYTDVALVELNYYIEAEITGVKEQFKVTEYYRVRYSKNRMYLLNYERRMEALFNINLASLSKNELKLGISSDYKVSFLTSADEKKLAFVRDRELWFYDLKDNEITRVFSFCQEKTDYLRDRYDQHDIRILSMDAEGNLDFLVYGYMNRGQYEGKVAILLYQYLRAENRIEELVYIPVEEPYQTLKENLGEFAYVNSKEVFCFQINNNIYSFNLITRELSEIATDIRRDQIVVIKDLNYVAWQENSDPELSENICIMNMDTGDIQKISTQAGYHIRLMDKIDSNIIYGYVKDGDITTLVDGSVIAPLTTVVIASVDKKILKSYFTAGYYVSDIEVNDNVIDLFRVQKTNVNGMETYVTTTNDYIMNQVKENLPFLKVTTRVTEQALTELYMTLPAGFTMTELPKVVTTVNTVISEDPTVRLQKVQQEQVYYYPYVMGGIQGAYEEAADAVEVARDSIGVVINNRQQLVWERGVKSTQNIISEFEEMTWTTSSDHTIESCLNLILSYQGVKVSNEQLAITNRSAYDVLKEYSKFIPVCLTGITLEDALYYVSMNRPVLAMSDAGNAVIIYGFDAFNIMIIDPKTNKVDKMGMQSSTDLFAGAGNVFLSYLGEGYH